MKKDPKISAFDETYLHYSPMVENFSYALTKNRREAEDITAEVFLKVWESWDEVAAMEYFPKWLFTVTKNVIYNRFKHDKIAERYVEDLIAMEKIHPASESIEDALDSRDMLTFVNTCIAKMPIKRRNIFLMSRVEGLSYSEIAQRLGISEKTVEYHISQALKDLRLLGIALMAFVGMR